MIKRTIIFYLLINLKIFIVIIIFIYRRFVDYLYVFPGQNKNGLVRYSSTAFYLPKPPRQFGLGSMVYEGVHCLGVLASIDKACGNWSDNFSLTMLLTKRCR